MGITDGHKICNSFKVLRQGVSLEEFKARINGFRKETFKTLEILYFHYLSYNLRVYSAQ